MTPQCSVVTKLEACMDQRRSLLCVGLDPDWNRLPAHFKSERYPLFTFCQEIIEQTAASVCAFKANTAFFEANGARGWHELAMTFAHLRENYPEVFTICDAKRGDIGTTNKGYVTSIFDELGADSITLHPYLGSEALFPFLQRTDRASIILCRTSNRGAGELQDLELSGRPLWEHTAERVSQRWNVRGNCMLVVGATWPQEMRRIREIATEMTFLVPGIGAQGGDIEAIARAGLRVDGRGLIFSSSRSILYASDPAQAARDTRDSINTAREHVYAGT